MLSHRGKRLSPNERTPVFAQSAIRGFVYSLVLYELKRPPVRLNIKCSGYNSDVFKQLNSKLFDGADANKKTS